MKFPNIWSKKSPEPKSDLDRCINAFPSSEGLSGVVLRLIQEVEVLKAMLRDKGVWDDAAYKQTMLNRMISDHNSAGVCPHVTHSYFPYALEEPQFLQYRFKASDDELRAFEEEVDYVSTLT